MLKCPVCDGAIDVEEDEIDEGDTLSCDECGVALRITGTDPIEVESAEDPEDEDEDDEDFLDEDDEEEEEEEEEDWK